MKQIEKFAIAAIILGLCFYGAALRIQNRFVVENRSGQIITQLQISTYKQKFLFPDIPVDGWGWSAFEMPGDDSYRITGKLQDGTKIQATGGYLTSGYLGHRDTMIIWPNGKVDVKQTGLI